MQNHQKIVKLLNSIESAGIDYIFLKKTDDCANKNLLFDSNVRILIKNSSKGDLKDFLSTLRWKSVDRKVVHPDIISYLYAMDKPDCYVKDDICLDVWYQISCNSTRAGMHIPIDQIINVSSWKNRICAEDYCLWELGTEDKVVCLLIWCIFDDKNFSAKDRESIEKLLTKSNLEEVNKRLKVIFFKFTPVLMNMIWNKDFDNIVHAYRTFTDY